MRVLAAIVTHNRCALLERCIDHVLAQSRPPDTLLVINNASTDGTESMLLARGIQHLNQANVGSAGGWHRALKHGLEQGYDCIWLMDDDGFPAPQALEMLLAELKPGVACVSSMVVQENDPARFVFPVPRLDANGLPVLFGMHRKLASVAELAPYLSNGFYPFAHLFNGALVNASAVERVGNVNVEYFIYGDEVDYFFRLRKAGKVYSVAKALHFHPDVSQRPLTELKFYYYVKNTLILNKLYFNRVFARNAATILVALLRTAQRSGLSAAGSYVFGRRKTHLVRAVRLGLRGQIGRDFNG